MYKVLLKQQSELGNTVIPPFNAAALTQHYCCQVFFDSSKFGLGLS